MTVGSLVAYQIGDDLEDGVVAATMLLTTLSIFHIVAGLMSRDQTGTIFDRDALPGLAQLRRYGVAALAVVAITTIDILERIFGTTELDGRQWGICLALAASLLVAEEAIKFFIRRRHSTTQHVVPAPTSAPVPAT
jgi:Ca2+-transporting ATPase